MLTDHRPGKRGRPMLKTGDFDMTLGKPPVFDVVEYLRHHAPRSRTSDNGRFMHFAADYLIALQDRAEAAERELRALKGE